MRTIIQQILSKAADKILKYYEENGIIEIARMAEDFKCISEEMTKELISAFIDSADEAICEAKSERQADGIRIHEKKVPRTVYTALGELSYARTYFNVPDGRSYLLDKILNVAPYERIDSGVSAKLVQTAAIHSFGQSTDIVTGGQISRQSVRNKIMNTGEVAYVPEKVDVTPESIHIFADEDHVNLQDGKNTIVPIITVCEGKRLVSKGRNKLIEPFHVQGYNVEPEAYWEYVYALCAQKYDMEKVRRIYVYGDGAAWIAKFTDVFPDAVHVLDEFHFKKRMKGLLAGEICSQFSLAAYRAVGKNDKTLFDGTIQNMLKELEAGMPEGKARAARIKAVMENAGYMLRHWKAIQNMKLSGTIGSCTEAMVSHVLSVRLSRNPMGWSKEGLSKISMIRVFVLNGGKVEADDTLAWKHKSDKNTVIANLEKYDALVKAQQDKVLKGAKHWRWFETNELISGKTTGTKVALDALGITRKVS